MFAKHSSSSLFSGNPEQARTQVSQEQDFNIFQQQSLEFTRTYHAELFLQWELFCKHIKSLSFGKAEKMLVMRAAFLCLENTVEQGELVQFITLINHLISVDGLQMISLLLETTVTRKERTLKNYLRIIQLLIDLVDVPGIYKTVEKRLPHLLRLLEKLNLLQAEQLALKYPERNIDTVIEKFSQVDDLVKFPLGEEELKKIKIDYRLTMNMLPELRDKSQEALRDLLKEAASILREHHDYDLFAYRMIAILVETMRRHYSILPYDTQIITLLALINTPEKLKGRIAQVKTGEGKSTIIALLAGFMASQGLFVDMVTSSGYLAKRDCKKYQPYFKDLGLSASHISHVEPQQKHFHAQILYGTNTDFEFAYLRDGLYDRQLRRSRRFYGELIERPCEVVIIDEVDNLFLDTALSSARMGVRDNSDISWIYEPIFQFVKSHEEDAPVTAELIAKLREHLYKSLPEKTEKYREQLEKFSDLHLQRWFNSAHTALYKKQLEKDYIIVPRKDKSAKTAVPELEVVIVDYARTGRPHKGCQWQYGTHQFVQVKEGCKITHQTKTGASVSHPTFFNLYQHVLGLTGTMGEFMERREIQEIYAVDTFDVPPHLPSIRERLPDWICSTRMNKWKTLLQSCIDLKQKGVPILILFKTIEESSGFSKYLNENKKQHQLLNETQREAEEYLIGKAGEAGMITIATNTAGRGTDIILSPESKANGGLHMIFAFYPDNLRVEGQGFGRAGRQGQPGACWMVLDTDDEFIAPILKMDRETYLEKLTNRRSYFEKLQKDNGGKIPDDFDVDNFFRETRRCAIEDATAWIRAHITFTSVHFHLQMRIFDARCGHHSNSAESIIPELNKLRTLRIKQESIQRFACAEQEKYYFDILQKFFSRMAKVYALTKEESFKEGLMELCTECVFMEEDIHLLDENYPHWISLKEMAALLVQQSRQGIAVDWSAFVERFIAIYLDHIRNLWADYYSKLQDEIEVDNRESAYLEVLPYLMEPEKMAAIILGQVFPAECHVSKLVFEHAENNEDDREQFGKYRSKFSF